MITSLSEFERLVSSEDPEERHRARHEPIAHEVMAEVLNAAEWIRVAVVGNKLTRAESLWLFVRDEAWRVRFTVAMRRCAGEKVLTFLAGDPDESIRALVARNPKVPRELLMRLTEDPSEQVRRAVVDAMARSKG